jgi:monovalent cation:H+ antiporter-2, CPA2 family
VRRIAIPGAVLQIGFATILGAVMAVGWGWTWGSGIVLGLSLSVASTVVLLKALEQRNAVESPNGRVAIGWLIVEDLAMVIALVLLPAFAGALGGHAPGLAAGGPERGLGLTLLITGAKVTTFVVLLMFFGPRVMPWLLRQVARTGSRELFTLCVLAVAIGIAFTSAELFGVSFALGAFFSGVVLSESELSHKAAANSLPLQDAFAVLFFVSVGMLFDPAVLVDSPLRVLGVLAVIVFGKALLALAIVLVLGFPLSTGLVAAASLAQVGEFSFILAGLGITLGLLSAEGLSLVLAGSIMSIAINPMLFWCTDRISWWVRDTPALRRRFEEGARGARLERLEQEFERVRHEQEARSLARRTVSPEELVAHFPLFSGLTPEQREVLLLHFETRKAQPGERIIHVGDEADTVYFISEGEVEVAPRRRQEKVKLQAGSFFGEMALLSGERRSADVTALDFTKLLTLKQKDFRRFLDSHPDVRAQMAAKAAERGAMNSRLPEIVTEETKVVTK